MYEKYKKMKKHYYYLITCLTALLLAACQNETPVERTHRAEFKLTLAGEIDQLYLSRVNDNGFADGDVMGVYVVDYVSQQPGKLQQAIGVLMLNILSMNPTLNGILLTIYIFATIRLR